VADVNTVSGKNTRYAKRSKSAHIGITVAAIILSLFIIMAVFAIFCIYVTDHIVYGVYYNEISLSKMNQREASDKIKNTILSNLDYGSLIISEDDYQYEVKISSIFSSIDTDAAAKDAYDIARSGNLFSNIGQFYTRMFSPVTVDPHIIKDEVNFDGMLDEVIAEIQVPVVEPYFEINEKNELLTVFPGSDGKNIDKDNLEASIMESFYTFGKDDSIILVNPEVETVPKSAIDMDKIAQEAICEPKDAAFVKNAEGQTILEREKIGVHFDIESAKAKAAEFNPETMTSIEIPITITRPKITYDQLKIGAFEDSLGKFSTKLNTNLASRTHNVRLATKKINGTILNPGEIFSFNKTVGPRTEQTGFKAAKIYAKDEIVDGIGGGICQVVSTLYRAMLNADLETVERRNHRFTVAYIGLGYDATVAYGGIDFRFRNNTNYPVKIVSSLKGSTLTIDLRGTKIGNKKVEYYTKTYNETPYEVREKYDSAMKPGTSKVETNGSKGYTVDTYKKVYEGGRLVSQYKIHTSVYKPCNKVIVKGPDSNKPPAPAKPTPTEPAAPSAPVEPTPTEPTAPPAPVEPTPTEPTAPPAPVEPAPTEPTAPQYY
jgi:vancomycin resistance protein YoaR